MHFAEMNARKDWRSNASRKGPYDYNNGRDKQANDPLHVFLGSKLGQEQKVIKVLVQETWVESSSATTKTPSFLLSIKKKGRPKFISFMLW